MKNYKTALFLLFTLTIFTNCSKDNDDNDATTNELNDFVYRGMNAFYLYKDDVPDLADNRFRNDNAYNTFLNDFNSPRSLFDHLVFDEEDRFSWIVDDFVALEQAFSGVSTSNGMEFQLFRLNNGIFGIITHILPNTSAARNGIKRGDVFYAINNNRLTQENINNLLGQDNYDVNLGDYNNNGTPEMFDDTVTETTRRVPLSKTQYTEDPILINNVLNVDGKQIAYLMYNSFTGTNKFNADLNTVFSEFKNANATELVLDLRYNSGGSVRTAIILSSLITGQFTDEIFSTEAWNSDFQEFFNNEDPELLINRFIDNIDGEPLQSLNLSRLYVLTSPRSASASELVINSLRPYINVVQIGTNTSGKFQASTTLYDSDNFRRQGANPNHGYAMQPLIFKSLNVAGVTDYFNGLTPDIFLEESIANLGELGTLNEPLLARAIADINGGAIVKLDNKNTKSIPMFSITNKSIINGGMYDDKTKHLNLLKKLRIEQ